MVVRDMTVFCRFLRLDLDLNAGFYTIISDKRGSEYILHLFGVSSMASSYISNGYTKAFASTAPVAPATALSTGVSLTAFN